MDKIDKDKIIKILKENNVEFAGFFGSYARGEETTQSDIDILVRLDQGKSLFDHIGIQQELSLVLNRRVDLVSERALSPYIREAVLADLKVFYGKR